MQSLFTLSFPVPAIHQQPWQILRIAAESFGAPHLPKATTKESFGFRCSITVLGLGFKS